MLWAKLAVLLSLQAIDSSVCSHYIANPQHQSKEPFMSRVAELQARIKADQVLQKQHPTSLLNVVHLSRTASVFA